MNIPSSVEPQELGFLLGRAHRARKRAWETSIADLGLTAPQALLLRTITANPGTGVRRLARALLTDPMNIQRITGTLIGAGLCEVHHDPADARRRPLHPTPHGRELAELIARRAADREQQLAEALGPEHYAALITGLQRLLEIDNQTDITARCPGGANEADQD